MYAGTSAFSYIRLSKVLQNAENVLWGWFFGFKLHLIINDRGEILNFMFTPGNVDDREPLKQTRFLKNKGKTLCGQRIYRSDAIQESFHGRHTADNQSEDNM